jgi:LysR family transcriptional regulator, transcriptional activator of nhaA
MVFKPEHENSGGRPVLACISAKILRMDWLNYHHLFYFWNVVREGTVSAASRKLRLAQPTISGQLKELEAALGVQLFQRKNGRLTLTDTGSHVYRYANEIFSLGHELQQSLSSSLPAAGTRLVVGVADVVPKLIAQRLLEPALRLEQNLRVECYEDRHERLLAELALYQLDVVITDTPVTASSSFRAYSHLLGQSSVSLFAKPKLAERLRRRFPQSLEGAPVLLPIEQSGLRSALVRWFEQHAIHPRIRGEFQDSALLTALGQAGEGAFAAPTVIEDEIVRQHRVAVVAQLPDIKERFYAVTNERRIGHAAVRAITSGARAELFRA